MTWVNPGGSPLGDTSQVPSGAEVATRQNGEAASHRRSISCSRARSLVTARGIGAPASSRSSSSEVISTMPDRSAVPVP